jgi:hypothetical protein
MRLKLPSFSALALAGLAAVLLLLACQLSQEGEVKTTLSFNSQYDSLKAYDHVVITLKDADDGHTLDVAFDGKVKVPGDLEKLPTPHWDGGRVLVVIEGFDAAGKLVYHVESTFDGKTNKRDSTYVFVKPGMGLSFGLDKLQLLEGDSIPLPAIVINPPDLSDKRLSFTSSAPDVIQVGPTFLKALKGGNSQVTVRLVADSAQSVSIAIQVIEKSALPESLALSADTLYLSAGGAAGRVAVSVLPSTASKDVAWSIDNTALATVSAEGEVKGVKAGTTWLRVQSALKASLKDSAIVVVSDPVPVEKVLFAKEATEIYVGGAAESLLVSVLPPKASPEVEFIAAPSEILKVSNGRVQGLAEGQGTVIARSKENPALTDTLQVKVTVKQVIDAVTLNKKTLVLYTGGETATLSASITPATSVQTVQWRSGNPQVAQVDASGKVTGLSPGHALIQAISQADSTKKDSADVTVKTDAPTLSVGRSDTTVSVGSSLTLLPVVGTQEYGLIVAYRYDLNGDGTWDDTASAVKAVEVKCTEEKTYTLRFYVRDTEGNETIAVKKVTAVVGPVVNIVSPQNGAYFTKAAISISWTIDGKAQTTGTDTVLKEGANLITRSAQDAAGKVFSASVTVYLDSTPPAKPVVKGGGLLASATPTWTWAPGGGGNGNYRIALDSESFAGAELKETLFTPATALSEGAHTLFVQERDAAGNWSASGKATYTIDLSGPGKPTVKLNVASPTNAKRPMWTWASGGGGAGLYQTKFDNGDFSTGVSAPTTDTSYTPAQNLGDGVHTLYVREKDAVGNWSPIASASVTIDTTPPGAPKVFGTTPTSQAPRWSWTSGGGGSGTYRYKVGGDPAGSPENKDTAYAQPSPVSKTIYILYIQERDAVGNWSPISTYSITYDLTKPTVAFKAPQTSGTYMTKSATVDIAGTVSGPQGAGTVKTVEYFVDGTKGGLSTNFTGDSTWSIKALPLSNNKTVALKVVATDVAGNQGEATLNLLMDNTAPTAPAFTTQPPAIVNKSDLRTSLNWVWSRTGDATDSFVVRLNGAEVARQTGTSYTINSISDGDYQLEVSEKDMTGNASGFTAATKVLVDRVVPSAPAPGASSPTRSTKPTWSWTSGASGQFEYRLAQGADPTGTGTALAATSYAPASGLADGSWYFQVREKDAADNWSAWSSSAIVVIKASAPSAPSVSRNATPTNSPSWSWTSGGGGNGTFRYRWNGNASYLGEGTATSYAPNISDGSYNLCVSEKDVIGYGGESCVSITVDKTPPVISGLSPTDGFITNKASLSVYYQKDGVSESFSCSLNDGASKVCSKTVYDAAGNPATVSTTIWSRQNVVFVKAGVTGGDGSSWDSPIGSLTEVLQPAASLGKEIWVAAGDYQADQAVQFWVGSGIKIYGGFPSTGYPNSTSQRNPAANSVKVQNEIFIADGPDGQAKGASNVTIDGLNFTGYGNVAVSLNSYQVTISNCSFIGLSSVPMAISVKGTSVRLENLVIKNNQNLYYGAISADFGAGTIDIVGGDIRSNNAEFGSGGIYVVDGTVTVSNNLILYGNVADRSLNQIKIWGGHLTISGCQIDEGLDGIITSDPSYLTYGENTEI